MEKKGLASLDYNTFLYSKENYLSIVKGERRRLVYHYFGKEIDEFFKNLFTKAKRMEDPADIFETVLPVHLSTSYALNLLQLYFQDLGYQADGTTSANKIFLKIW